MKRVSNLLGEDYAKELAATYVTYTLPHTEKEKKEMIEMKHHQLFTKEFNRFDVNGSNLKLKTLVWC